jgi:ApbE superfamily uncharacterized protein (UPF0280 family)
MYSCLFPVHPAAAAVFLAASGEMHIFANTLSTRAVNTNRNPLNSRDLPRKVDPGDRELYRVAAHGAGLVQSRVVVKETDLQIFAERDIAAEVREIVLTERDRLERYIAQDPGFRESLVPVPVPGTAPWIVRAMARAGAAAGVGPMAAVAGAVCEAIARALGAGVTELIIENGGDLHLASARERTVGIFTGTTGADLDLRLRFTPERMPVGVCTSSGRIGHSLSFGEACAATVVARSATLADAAATAVGNRVRGAHGVREALATARAIPGVLGAVVLRAGELGAWGDVEIVGV